MPPARRHGGASTTSTKRRLELLEEDEEEEEEEEEEESVLAIGSVVSKSLQCGDVVLSFGCVVAIKSPTRTLTFANAVPSETLGSEMHLRFRT